MDTIIRGVLVGEERPSDVVVRDGEVVSVSPAGAGAADIGSSTSIIGPTLFDIQVNGVAGIDLQRPGVAPEDVVSITDTLARGGVSHWVPTLITGPHDAMERACRVIAEALQEEAVARAALGIHLEGPHISPKDGPRGAHPKQHVRKPDIHEFDRLLDAAAGKILYTTVAPEIEGAVDFIKAVLDRGVVVALGHHDASADDVAKAVDAGARFCTHLGNGLASMIHRHHNPLWAQLAEDRLAASFIPDLEHLPPAVLKSLIRAKRPENTVLTSDCVHLAGLDPGKYDLGGTDVELLPSGRICLSGTDLLAGSSLMLLQGIVNAFQVADLSVEQAFASATTIPAGLLGLELPAATPAVGRKADLVVFDVRDGQAVLHAVFVNGRRMA